jgi:adenosylcobinamide-GDP ribazoletransferase
VTGLLGALQFLTRVPIRLSRPVPHERVLPWFAVAGALIGGVVGGVAVGLVELVPNTLAACLAVVAGLLLTGAFHEDGLADMADAFGGGWTVEERLRILKDSRHGTYGVTALASSIVVRVVAAASIASSAALFAAFVSAHTLGRAAAVTALGAASPAAESGLGVEARAGVRPGPTIAGQLGGVGIVVVVAGWWTGPFVAGSAVALLLVVWLAVRKIGGLAGDVLGAVEQVVECTVLVVASGLAAHHQIWWA